MIPLCMYFVQYIDIDLTKPETWNGFNKKKKKKPQRA